nr:zinc finger protein ZAT4-like [Ipomoea batatas]
MASNTNKRMYKLRTNPNRLKSVRVCENCGQEFFSWKSFLEHGKCGSDDDVEEESLVSSPGSDADESFGRRGHGWSKRKRSLRARYLSSEDEDLLFAKCLVDLANSRVYSPPPPPPPAAEAAAESSSSASKEEERRHTMGSGEFLAPRVGVAQQRANKSAGSKGLFECKACKKVFTSHQALGGHRASHKKVKGCYAAKQDVQESDSLAEEDALGGHRASHKKIRAQKNLLESSPNEEGNARKKKKEKIHECPICFRVFSSGQALGGHKRSHFADSVSAIVSPEACSASTSTPMKQGLSRTGGALIDLNLPAPYDEDDDDDVLSFPC